ncbi:alpha/beta fold hydrolase [Ancylobacter lacus]|uniref:alpha/beta fold hydrolase n=1 Tax=Ancylobacter lacus TaxID=2579970 RepID=UPI001BCE321C|nr:hypothetical protein [Ancylobacter lacus]MBS7539831.1 hypothetical protein [Ancylobacter lacus]
MNAKCLVALLALLLPAGANAQETRPTVLLLDGLGVYVKNDYIGVSPLAGPLRQQGYDTVLDTHFMTHSGGLKPAVIIGHSLGGTSALRLARKMAESGQTPPLVITIDAAPGSPGCVGQCINIHGPGFPDIPGARNVDAWKSGAFLVSHAMLATNPSIQRMVLQLTAQHIAHLAAPAEASPPRAVHPG